MSPLPRLRHSEELGVARATKQSSAAWIASGRLHISDPIPPPEAQAHASPSGGGVSASGSRNGASASGAMGVTGC